LLDNIAGERKLAEFEKTLSGPYKAEALLLFAGTGVGDWLPGLKDKKSRLLNLAGYKLHLLSREEVWTMLVHELELSDEAAEVFLRNWKLPVKRMRECLQILRWLRYRMRNKWTPLEAYLAGKNIMLSAEKVYISLTGAREGALKDLEQMFAQLPIKKRADLSVTGKDLMSWIGKRPGPWIKDYLNGIEEAVIAGEVANSKADIREWLVECKQNLEKD
jgi:tRNA nucleotidyltransferase (CCA-adding enzyme)